MKNGFSAIAVAFGTFFGAHGSRSWQDEAFRARMWIAFVTIGLGTILMMRRVEFATPARSQLKISRDSIVFITQIAETIVGI